MKKVIHISNIGRITNERALISYITQPCPIIICDCQFCVKKKIKHARVQSFSPFSMVGTTRIAGYCASSTESFDHSLRKIQKINFQFGVVFLHEVIKKTEQKKLRHIGKLLK